MVASWAERGERLGCLERFAPKSHAAGVLSGFLAALSVGCDGLFVKLASRDGASLPFTMAFKAGTGVCFLLVIMLIQRALSPSAPPHIKAGSGPRSGWPSTAAVAHISFGALSSGIMSSGFTLAFYYATSANVLAFTALSPIWTALLARPVLGITLPWRTVWANLGALVGVAVVVVGVALEAEGDAPRSARDTALGTGFAIVTSITAALYFTTIRSAQMRAPDAEMLYASLFGMALSTAIGLALIPALHPADEPLMPAGLAPLWLTLGGLFVVALALVFITVGVRLASPAEISLLLQLEGLLGPISVYIFLREVPSPWALGGGAIVLLMVGTHEALALREASRAHRPDGSTAGIGRIGVAAGGAPAPEPRPAATA
jgi:drug/metabolite transporter (DMT)-like permease